jgi:hypothetical protein
MHSLLTRSFYPGKITAVTPGTSYTAFLGSKRIACGGLEQTLRRVKGRLDRHGDGGLALLIFDDQTGKQVDFDLRGPIDRVLARALPAPARSGPGRPKLGVVSREVSLLPRHWEWLESQPSGASAALRRLVEEARKNPAAEARTRIDALGRVMTAMGGNLAGFEEAYRSLYARDWNRLRTHAAKWPKDLRDYVSDALAGIPITPGPGAPASGARPR